MDIILYRDYEVERGEIIQEHGQPVRVRLCMEMTESMQMDLIEKGLSSWANKRFKIIAEPVNPIKIEQGDPEVE